MRFILRQEWKASKKRIKKTSVILAVIILGSAVVNFIAYKTRTSHVTFFGSFLYICSLFILTIGIPVFALARGSGNIRSMLFEDTNYLALLVPCHSYEILGARQIINLLEFIIYFIPGILYLSLLGPTGGLVWNFGKFATNPGYTYWHNVLSLYREFFIINWKWSLQSFCMILVSFAAFQSTINCAFAIYAAFVHSRKTHKFLMAVIIFLLFYIEIRVSTWGLHEILFNRGMIYQSHTTFLWYHLGIFLLFGFLYFVVTSWLLEWVIET